MAQQVAAERQRKAAARMAARKAAGPPAARSASGCTSGDPDPIPLTAEQLMAERRAAWRRSRIVSLRALGLAELPDLQAQWRELGPDAAGEMQAMDIGNNALRQLPGAHCCCHVLWPFLCTHRICALPFAMRLVSSRGGRDCNAVARSGLCWTPSCRDLM